tara:strand:+ start:271 stop:447 length:177 start_codon:yes stop_codon:yes gene_type:complete
MKNTKVEITPHVKKLINDLVNLPFPKFNGHDNSAEAFKYNQEVKNLCIRLKRFSSLQD